MAGAASSLPAKCLCCKRGRIPSIKIISEGGFLATIGKTQDGGAATGWPVMGEGGEDNLREEMDVQKRE